MKLRRIVAFYHNTDEESECVQIALFLPKTVHVRGHSDQHFLDVWRWLPASKCYACAEGFSLIYLLCNSLARSFGKQTLHPADPKLLGPLFIGFATRSIIQSKRFPLSETSSLDRDLLKMPLTTFYKWEVGFFESGIVARLTNVND